MSDSNGVNPVVIVLIVGVLLLVAGGGVLLMRGTASSAVATASSGRASAFQGYRHETHPEGALATAEVTLSVDGQELVRRGVWAADGALDAEASGFFVARTRARPLSAIEVEDLIRLTAVAALDVHTALASSLLAKD